jgi:DNA repair photolyase
LTRPCIRFIFAFMAASPRQASALPQRRLVARGAADNPANRFDKLAYEVDAEAVDSAAYLGLEQLGELEVDEMVAAAGDAPLPTEYFHDPSRTLLATNSSPDVGFDTSLNPYRGCAHGCVYCFARPMHEYLGYSAGLDFETKILVKNDAPALLRKALSKPSWKPRVVSIGAATDPYQPVERRLRLTRRCIEVFAEFRNPIGIVTKGSLVARDVDLLADMAEDRTALVHVSITSLDDSLRRVLEPRAASPGKRLATVEALAEAGVPVGVLVAPVIPGLTDSEIPRLVQAAADAGAQSVGHITLRLPHGVKDLFGDWLERHFPERKHKVLNRIRELRGGRLNDPRYHSRFRGSGVFGEQIEQLFQLAVRRADLPGLPKLSTEAFRRPESPQLSLF